MGGVCDNSWGTAFGEDGYIRGEWQSSKTSTARATTCTVSSLLCVLVCCIFSATPHFQPSLRPGHRPCGWQWLQGWPYFGDGVRLLRVRDFGEHVLGGAPYL